MEELNRRTPISGHKLATLIVESQRSSPRIVDPRIPVFIVRLHDARIINSYDVLAALFRECTGESEPQNRTETPQTYEVATNVLDHLTRCFLTAKSPKTIPETRQTLAVLSRWLEVVATTGTDSNALLESLDHNAILLYDYLGSLSIAMLENVRVGGVIEKAITPGMQSPLHLSSTVHMFSRESLTNCLRKTEQHDILAHALTVFVPFWAQTSPQHAQNIARLEDVQKHHSLVEELSKTSSDDNAMDVAAAMQVEAIIDLTLMHTRAALFIFLNSLVGDITSSFLTPLTMLARFTTFDR